MEEDNNIKNFSASDIERYHKGLMSSPEMHALEKAAMDDPFLADALEGYAVVGVNVENDLADLQNRLAGRTGSKKMIVLPAKRYYWMRVAAMIVVIAGAGILAYTLLNRDKQENVAQNKQQETNQGTLQVTDSSKYSNSFTKADTVQRSEGDLSISKNYKLPADTEKLKISNDAFLNSEKRFQYDSASFSAANTTRDLASGDIVTAPATNNAAQPAALEKKELAKQKDSLVVITPDKKDKASEEFASREVIVNRSNAKSYKAKDNSERMSGQIPGISVNTNRQLADSVGYGRLNVFHGRVTDAYNNGISFANVTINDVNVGTYADAKGYFSLVAADSVLKVSLRAVGFNNSQAQLKNSLPTNQVVLQEDKSIDAIVMSNKKPNANRSRTAEMELTEPEPNDGWEKYDDYLANNLKAPEVNGELEKKGGEVELTFDIDSEGNPVNIKVTKSLCKECDEEAKRLLREGPKWKKKKKREKGKITIAF